MKLVSPPYPNDTRNSPKAKRSTGLASRSAGGASSARRETSASPPTKRRASRAIAALTSASTAVSERQPSAKSAKPRLGAIEIARIVAIPCTAKPSPRRDSGMSRTAYAPEEVSRADQKIPWAKAKATNSGQRATKL